MNRLFTRFFIAGSGIWLLINISSCNAATDNTSPANEAAKEKVAAPGPKSDTIYITQMNFVPAAVLAHKGDTVVFINNDPVDHNITEEIKKAWSSSPLHNGQSWTKVVEESVNYYCSLHPVMKGQIVVE